MSATSPPIRSLALAVVVAVALAAASSGTAATQHGTVLRLAGATRSLVPTDPFWAREWGAKRIGAPRAWATTRGNPRIVVATLDSGVDASHPDLRGALVPGIDLANGDDDPADDNGHGTAVAGVIAARADNGIGISGICPRCALMPVKVTDSRGVAIDSVVARGITWAVDHGARVINLSLGGDSSSQTIDAALRYARAKGALVVAAAGNNGSSAGFYPAASDGVLGVASTDPRDRLYGWSNYGGWVDVAAPGCSYTTAAGAGYAEFCGTSASAPVVAGLLGLLLAAAPGRDVETSLAASAHRLPAVAAGRVDAAAALRLLGRATQRPAAALRMLRAIPLEPKRKGR